MMLTRCPECATVFRVTPDQLKARQGRVRCGRCHRVFNAIDALIENVPVPLLSALDAAPPSSAVATEQPTAQVQGPNPEPTPEPIANIVTAIGTPEHDAPLITETIEAEHSAECFAEEPSPQEQTGGEPLVATVVATTEAGAPAVEPIAIAAEPRRGDNDTFAAEPAFAPVVDIAMPGQSQSIAEELPAAEPLAPDQVAPPLSAMEPLLHEPPHRRINWPWLVAAVAFSALLAGQAALFYRVELAIKYPQLHASFASICEQLNCDMPLPRHIDLIGIEASDLNPGSGKGRLHFSTTLKNRADFAQEYPHLELTLTDTQDQPLVRRALSPADYLPTAPAPDGFAARAETAVALTIDASSIPASGYRLYVFYP
jgi:predicted Zn finger-like uncharacterized protein